VTKGEVPGLIDPVAEYDHTGPNETINGEAAIGGYVYRGTGVPELAGRYVFGDYSLPPYRRAHSGFPGPRRRRCW
jgi:hypothetical protein